MQKYSHTSRRVQKELGGSVYALAGRVDNIEEDITRFEGYEKKVVKYFSFKIATATEQTLKAVLENSEVADWITHSSRWTSFTISAVGNDTLNGTYDDTYTTKKTSGVLNFKSFFIQNGEVVLPQSHTLKANTSTGAIDYDSTDLDITGTYTSINIQFRKGVL